tara:strand:- start:2720 stop:3286 length:567 start_codon:yes stop_codon:yes gene_type:complete
MTREEWLLKATKALESQFFNRRTTKLPAVAVSCGIPKGSSNAIGQCWDSKVASDGTTQIFICPSIDDTFQVLGVLLHELCHAAVGVRYGHGPEFGRVARAVGLKGKLTATVVEPESDTGKYLLTIQESLGLYPHKSINKRADKKKGQRPKRVKLCSPKHPSYEITILEELLTKGLPVDPWGDTMELSR